jgi:cell division protein FtsZ
MTINLNIPDIRELKPRITVFGVGGAGGNAVNNMIAAGLQGVDFVVANTDAQALTTSKAERIVQIGVQVTQGLGAGSNPEIGRAAADEAEDEIRDHLSGVHMVFVTAGMGGGTGTGAAPVIAKVARELGILTVGVVTKPFHFEGLHRMRTAESGIAELTKCVDTLLIIPNQNLFRVANEKTTITDAFAMADQVLYSGVACITDLMVKEGLINLDFADVRAVMREMGKAMMGTGEYEGEQRALKAAEAAISNPLIDDEGRQGPAHLHHRRPRPEALRSRRSRDAHSWRGRSGRQHHRRRHLRREPRRRHPRLGRRYRHRSGGDSEAELAADRTAHRRHRPGPALRRSARSRAGRASGAD